MNMVPAAAQTGMTTWLLVVIGATGIDADPCCCRATDPDMAVSGSTGWYFVMA